MIDKNEAPDGYEAVKSGYLDCCSNCVFDTNGYTKNEHCKEGSCHSEDRTDGEEVYFIKKPVETKGISGSLKVNVDFSGACFNVNATLKECHQGGYSPFNKCTIEQQYLAKENVTPDEIKAMVTVVVTNLFSGKGVINAEA